jgi:anti-anti-sigma regulatory factor
MDESTRKYQVRIIGKSEGESVVVEGELNESNAGEFERRLRGLAVRADGTITLNLLSLDIEDGIAVATAVNSLRELRARSARLVVECAPQILGHNLYRVGLLDGAAAIELIDMRQDEPSGF